MEPNTAAHHWTLTLHSKRFVKVCVEKKTEIDSRKRKYYLSMFVYSRKVGVQCWDMCDIRGTAGQLIADTIGTGGQCGPMSPGGGHTACPFQGGWRFYQLNWTRMDFGRAWVLFLLVTTKASALNANVSQRQLVR